MDNQDLKRTPLFDAYAETPGARLVDFGGWHLPVQFASGILVEHKMVRESAGFFDVSHMGEILVEGEGALALLQRVCTADIAKLNDFEVCYSLMCEPDGGVVDDVLVYRYNAQKFWVVVNASNRDKDASWIKDAVDGIADQGLEPIREVHVENISHKVAQIAVQGPKAVALVADMLKLPSLLNIPTFGFSTHDYFEGDEYPMLISRTGYTGEDGFEIYLPNHRAIALWKMLEAIGDECIPCGLGARDTLRFEAKMPLYGHELSDMITPLEANLSWAVALEKEGFIGRDALLKQKEDGIPRTLRGCVLKDKGIARSEYPVYRSADPEDEEVIGYVTSGSPMPSVGGNAALVLMSRGSGLGIGASIYIDVRGKRKEAELVKTPFYKRRRTL